jgi:mono/diheme cytochrome c family protein
MRLVALTAGIVLFAGAFRFPPQQTASTRAALSDSQKEGRRTFQQKCAVCHVPIAPSARQYGPGLSKALVAGNEDFLRKTIMNGSGDRMPGWKYALEPKQIDDIIDYLKTLETPARTVASERDEM